MPFFNNRSINHIRRREEFRSLAYQLDMDYQPRDEFGMFNLLEDFQLFQKGFRRRIRHILTREDAMYNHQTAIFDYQYTVHRNKRATTYYQTVFFIESRRLALPQFLMKPEHFFHRIGKFLGLTQDIDFTAWPDFSEKYLIQGEEPELVTDMMNDKLARLFTIEDTWSLEGIGYYLIFYQKHRLLPPPQVKQLYRQGMEIANWLQAEDPFVPPTSA
jgi:hypothetical protein